MVGYQLFSSYIEAKATGRLERQLDNNKYDESNLIAIKVPAKHLGYYINSKQFERVDGQIEIAGTQYNFVKRRLYNDSVEMLCIPNHAAMQVKTAKDNFFKLVNDLQHPGQNKKSESTPGSYKNFTTDYYTVNDLFNIHDLYYCIAKGSFYYSAPLTSCPLSVIGQPPEETI